MDVFEQNRDTRTFGAERSDIPHQEAEQIGIDDEDVLTFLFAISCIAFVLAAVFFAAIGWFRTGSVLVMFGVVFGFVSWFFVTYGEQ